VSNINNLISNTTPDKISSTLNDITKTLQSQPTSSIIPITNNLTVNSINAYYSLTSSTFNSSNPIIAMTTSANNTLDISKIPKIPNVNVLLPIEAGNSMIFKLDNNSTVNVKRGLGSRSNQISIDGGSNWISYGQNFKIGNNTYTYSASGSPIIITTTSIYTPSTYSPTIPPPQPYVPDYVLVEDSPSPSSSSSDLYIWIGILLVVLIILFGVWYFYFRTPIGLNKHSRRSSYFQLSENPERVRGLDTHLDISTGENPELDDHL